MSKMTIKPSELYEAIENCSTELVAKFLEQGGDPNEFIPDFDMSPMHLAVGLSGDDPFIVSLLLSHKGDPNSYNCSESYTPLHLCILYNFSRLLILLMDHGGDPLLTDGEGKNCFDLAQEYGHYKLTQILIDLEEERNRTLGSNGEGPNKSSLSLKYKSSLEESKESSYYSCQSQPSEQPSLQPIIHPPKHSMNIVEDPVGEDIGNGHDLGLPEESEECDQAEDEPRPSSPIVIKPPRPPPSSAQIKALQNAMNNLNLRYPVTKSTYSVLSRKFVPHNSTSLSTVTSLNPPSSREKSHFSRELHSAILNISLVIPSTEWELLKNEIARDSTCSGKKSAKNYYNYLLLDPFIIETLVQSTSVEADRGTCVKDGLRFKQFLSAVFYIGKGCGIRPIRHLIEAKNVLTQTGIITRTMSNCPKIKRILDIWNNDKGVLVLSLFHQSGEAEALTLEACMIDSLGLESNDLTNSRKGSYTASVMARRWPQRTKNLFGAHLLYRAFGNWALGNGRSFYPQDI